MAAKKENTEGKVKFAVGDRVKINLHTVRAIIDHTDGQKLQVDFGKDETVLIDPWRVVKKIG